MILSNTEKLRRFYEIFTNNDQALILINADPDAIGSALAVKRLLWRLVAGVTIVRINEIKRPDNLAMMRLLDATIDFIDNINQKDFNRFVLVDSQPNHSPIFEKFNFDVIIDHHPDTGIEAPFTDIRPDYGSNATILTEYLKAAKIKPSSRIATGLFYGIKTDTGNFERHALIEDVRAFQYLFKYVNIHMIRKMEFAELRIDFLEYYKIALDKMNIRNGSVFVHLRDVVNPDVCVSIADFFTRVHSLTWSIVSGIYNGILIIIFRNDGMQKDAGKTAQKAFGPYGSAGGHKSMARAEIPEENSKIKFKNHDKISQWIIERIEEG